MKDFKNDSFSLGDTIFKAISEFLTETLSNTYPNLKTVKFSAISTYPQVVFLQKRSNLIAMTTRSEERVKNVEFELNIYAVSQNVSGKLVDAGEVLEDITNVATAYLERVFGSANVNVTTGLTNFDSKNIQSEKAIIQFTTKWLQDKNKYI